VWSKSTSLPNANAFIGLFRSLAERLAFLGHINKGESNPDLLFGDERIFIVSPSLWIVRLGAASCSVCRRAF
jgi:hypothetical protein